MSKANTPNRERSPADVGCSASYGTKESSTAIGSTEAESDAEQCEDTTCVSKPNINE